MRQLDSTGNLSQYCSVWEGFHTNYYYEFYISEFPDCKSKNAKNSIPPANAVLISTENLFGLTLKISWQFWLILTESINIYWHQYDARMLLVSGELFPMFITSGNFLRATSFHFSEHVFLASGHGRDPRHVKIGSGNRYQIASDRLKIIGEDMESSLVS